MATRGVLVAKVQIKQQLLSGLEDRRSSMEPLGTMVFGSRTKCEAMV